MQTKKCTRCKEDMPLSEFNFCKANNGKKYPSSMCKSCNSDYRKEFSHKKEGVLPYEKNPNCSQYLGVHIAERVLSHYFEEITRMPYGNPGYDFICKKGLKIDAKSGCPRNVKRNSGVVNSYWMFQIDRNKTADYFLCIGFDGRTSLNPLHIWLIPGGLVNTKKMLEIPISDYGISKWSAYEKPLDKVIKCCNALREH